MPDNPNRHPDDADNPLDDERTEKRPVSYDDPRTASGYNPDDDVPFKLPMADELDSRDLEIERLRATDDPAYVDPDSSPVDPDAPYDPDEDVPFKLPRSDEGDPQPTYSKRDDPHAQLTMPHFREPGVPDPRETLPGTGGLDPNPDMPINDGSNSARTVQNFPQVPHHVAHEPSVQRPDSGQTMPSAAVGNRYRRPQQAPPVQQAQGRYMPPAPPERGKRPSRSSRRRRRFMGMPTGCFFMLIGLFVTFCGGTTLFTIGAAAIFIPRIEARWGAEVERVDDYRAFESTFYMDRYGNSLYEAFTEGRRDTVRYEAFPQDLINASVAIEDDTFWTNIGVDVPATVVAALNYLGASDGERTPGGSTITQQVVRNILFDFEYRAEISVTRKMEEIILAALLTTRRSKEDIMTLYLNEIYYGNLAYGAQAAAQTFFNKDVSDLTLGEAALLAGLPQAPVDLDPLNPDPAVQDRVFNRWRRVLEEMLEEGYITQEEFATALGQGFNIQTPEQNNLRAPHFTVYAQNEFEDLMISLGYSPEDVARGGYRVYTTLDQNINNLALGAARTQISNLQGRNVSNASVVIIHPVTGQIVAMVGSIDYNNDAIDGRVNVAIALRQPGSTMKPFTYASALELGMTPADIIWDTPVEIAVPGQPVYRPQNYDRAFHGPMGMRRALANSYNIPAVQTLRMVGVDYLLAMMRRVGVTTLANDPGRYGISLTLGGGEVSLLELTNAYGVFANNGAYVEPTSILCVVDSDEQIIYQYENGCPQDAGRFTAQTVDVRGYGQQVMDPGIAYIITDILGDNIARSAAMGVNSTLNTPGIPTSVKTGTTDDIKDNWTIGYTGNVVVGVWVGNNNGDPMVNSSGLTGAAPIWNSVITSIYNEPGAIDVFRTDGRLLPDKPRQPGNVFSQEICNARVIREDSAGCPGTLTELFLTGPAGVPDGSGNLVASQQPLAGSSYSDYMLEISPDIHSVLAYRLDPAVAASLQFQLEPGDLPPPAPRYCRVPPQLEGAALAAGAADLTFIAGPATSHNDAVRAQTWAQQNNYAYLPDIECWDGAFTAGAGWGAPIVTAVISSPAGGQAVGNPVTIIGTVQFDSSQADFWHLDIIGGQYGDWTPMGQPGYGSVVNGALFSGVLPPGSYRVRLRLVSGGNYLQQPYEVAFTVQ